MTQDDYINSIAAKITEATYKETDPKDYTPWQKAMEANSKTPTIENIPHGAVRNAYEDEKKDPEFQEYIKNLQAKLFPKR